MPSIFRPKHRRVIITDLSGPVTPVADVTNEARCTRPDTHGSVCVGMCPRHNPVDYADMMARHATDSLPSVGTLPTRWMTEREHAYHTSNQWGR
jgi:hypothetical protein